VLAEDPYLLSDRENEAKYAFQISDTQWEEIIRKQDFYLTPKVPIDVKLMKNAIVSGGGQVSFHSPCHSLCKPVSTS
jgi:mediator of DNA damage checkpoint protein 1